MRRVPETNISLRNNNCSTALSTARCYFEATDDFPIFVSLRRLFLKISTEIKREDIIQSLMTRKIVIFQEISSMNVDYFRYLVLASNFLNFRLCEIQLGAQCLLGEHGPLKKAFDTIDHVILLKKLNCYGVDDGALAWFRSYLEDRQEMCYVNGVTSSMANIPWGVPKAPFWDRYPFLYTLTTFQSL